MIILIRIRANPIRFHEIRGVLLVKAKVGFKKRSKARQGRRGDWRGPARAGRRGEPNKYVYGGVCRCGEKWKGASGTSARRRGHTTRGQPRACPCPTRPRCGCAASSRGSARGRGLVWLLVERGAAPCRAVRPIAVAAGGRRRVSRLRLGCPAGGIAVSDTDTEGPRARGFPRLV